ncbi:MAG: HipA domain-containing protein [Hyphomonas sp.]|uniref:type II toxin-antitoxin system HipA family toxin n=1 Tax=Hyphomonas sp. TaxID=87 RepID=UPI0005F15E07|nr:HipA domain-containing protein [Hyphomonas sp.]KJS28034.1 MAG: phosphatidylinositol kinase [Hyphomonadaceae bacterium BRH_c29]MBU3920119.1 HipA domain-containing protein [Alphaproteobacteria bacterium]MBA3070170.1 HipA domain-containing protein [Hyphomonas sp.]MBU4060254.1 HipA domain-containing protein [Alphaproteobacteria bacterium]MBU4162922.1 HipA domain-containing protein [Alphaproteobacteria bacterium]
MTSEVAAPGEAFVWIWLPGALEPVVAGRIARDGQLFVFNYGQSYLNRTDAISLLPNELPLQAGLQRPLAPLTMAGCLRDASPDAWGRRVIINRLTGLKGQAAGAVELGELTYLLESGSDRIGGLDFQAQADAYIPRGGREATLEELQASAEKVLAGEPLHPEIDRALHHGSSIGGARPKALLTNGDKKLIAKFSASSDTYSVVKAEFIAMRLAARCGIDAAPVELVSVSGKDILLVERFDRVAHAGQWSRRMMISALTLFGLDELAARHASYEDLAEIIRTRFTAPRDTLHNLFRRLVFNILVGNTDDHARNHAAFWDGQALSLTPAYDICPQARTGREANQAMKVHRETRQSQLVTALRLAPACLLDEAEAARIITYLVEGIAAMWTEVVDEAELSDVDRRLFWRRQFLHPYAFEGVEGPLSGLACWVE